MSTLTKERLATAEAKMEHCLGMIMSLRQRPGLDTEELVSHERQLAAIMREVADAREEDHLATVIPDEPGPDSVIEFKVMYADLGHTYTYVGYRIPSSRDKRRWYLTGSGDKYTWEEVVQIMRNDRQVTQGRRPLHFDLLTTKVVPF